MLKISNKLTIKCGVLLALASYSYGVNAQDNMLPIPPTPQAAQFMRYGDIPVGHTTGVPQIEIPIYTISTGLIDIPISISYHASGFKVNDVASPVGLGWVLNANGWMISRCVEGIPDHYDEEYRLDSDNTIRTPEDLEKVKKGEKIINGTDFSNEINAEDWHDYFIKNGSWPLCDVRSDRYFYSLPGHMGSAQYSADNMDIGLQTIPYEPLVFKYDTDNETYTITDTKGIKYTFSQKEYNSPNGRNSKYISGWYLTSIKFSGLTDEVTFTYKEGEKYTIRNYVQTDTYYNRYEIDQSPYAVDCVDPYHPVHSVQCSAYTTNPVLLSEIKWKNIVVRFTYTSDRDEIQSERLTQINVYSKTGNNEVCIKQVKFNNKNYFGMEKWSHRLKLSSIEFSYSGEKYTFSYDESKNNDLPKYYWASDINSVEDYWGYWNGTSSYWVFPQALANHYNSTKELKDAIKGVDKDPSLEYTKACVLTEITYPTKGKTRFEYELNVGTFNSQYIKTKNGKLGGLRVRSVTNYSNDGSTIGTKEYKYSGQSIYEQYSPYGEFDMADLFVSSKPFVDFYTIIVPAGGESRAQLIKPSTYTSTPLQCFFDASRSPVFYDEVTEYNGSKNNNSGWTIYHYIKANDKSSINTFDYSGERNLLTFVKSVDCDFGNNQGILTQQIFYNKDGKKQYEKTINYSNYVKTLKTGVRMDLYLDVEDGSLTHVVDFDIILTPDYDLRGIYKGVIFDNIIAVQTYAYQTISEPTSEIEWWYDEDGRSLKKQTSYSYYKKSDGLPVITKPIRTTVTNSDGVSHDEFNYYSCQQASALYKEMNAKNMYEYLVRSTTDVSGVSNGSVETPYQKSGNLYLPKTLIKDNVQRVEYLNYDSRGNLNYAIKDGSQKVVTLYSYNYTHPVFVVEGATLKQVTDILKNNGFSSIEQLGAAIPSDEQIVKAGEALRSGLQYNSMVSTYTYKMNVGLTSATDCRGYKTLYEYDSAGRLINVWEQNGSNKTLLNNYKYNYSTN
ncbi:MAG: RHS repeat protein [Salinivirgaceae bacterium]|nr:RHS repeat protein [Salinivirgaceae bacterium]